MDNMDNSKATPTKSRTRNDANLDNDVRNDVKPEIDLPNPSIATPPIPDEMPARDVR